MVNYEVYDDTTRKKPSVKFSKLVVPSRMRSIYWKYFGFPAHKNGTIMTKDVIVCVLCKSQMIYNHNTSNLKMHLSNKHKNIVPKLSHGANERIEKCDVTTGYPKSYNESGEYHQYGIDSPGKTTDSTDISMIVSEEICETDMPNIAIILPDNDENSQYNKEIHESVESVEINDATVNFIVTDLVSPDIVEGKGFRSLVSTLANKTLVIPNEKKLVNDVIPNLFKCHKEQVFNMLMSNCITNISLSIEEWLCADGIKCLSIYMHYLQNGEPILQTKLLTSVCCTGSEDIQYWNAFLDSLLARWSISYSNISAVLMSFSVEELKDVLAMKNVTLIPCFLYVMQNVCCEHCFNHPEVLKILKKCRRIVKLIQETKASFAPDDGDLAEEENEEIELSLDHPAIWLTTYYMLRGLILRKKALTAYLQNQSFELNPNEWKDIEDLLSLLKSFKTVFNTLFEEKNSLISLLKPLIWRISTSEFKIEHQDSSLIKQLKYAINNVLNKAYSSDEANHFAQMATLLDPRFRAFTQQDESFKGEDDLKNLLIDLIDRQGSCSPTLQRLEKSPNSSGINVLFGNFQAKKITATAEEKASAEVAQYQSENGALLEECPLEWWQRMNNKCPNLIRLAQNYHCVPARVTYDSRTVKDYISFCYKRATLKTNILDSLLFLHVNKCLLQD